MQQTPRLAAGAALLALVLAGCGGSSSGGSASGGSAPTAAGAGATPAATAGAVPTTPDCAAATTVKSVETDSHITAINVDGGCSQVSIETSLTRATGVEAATKICEAAAKVAYVGNISSVSVDGADHHELAAGEKGQDGCIGEP